MYLVAFRETYRFSHSVVLTWSLLPEVVVSGPSIDSSKSESDILKSLLEKD